MKIDFHTHILPELDDGASSLELSLEMLDRLRVQQVDKVVLTPHYYSHRESITEFLEKRQQSFSKLVPSFSADMPKIYLGAEVYFSDYLFNNKNLADLCIADTRVMLLELPYNKTVDDRMIDKIDRLIGDYGITPVIAHIERYPSLIRSRRLLDRLLMMGCVLQVNVSSFSRFGKHRLLRLLEKGYIGALGTDAHNLTTRSPDYNSGYSWLQKHVDIRALNQLQFSMEELLMSNPFV